MSWVARWVTVEGRPDTPRGGLSGRRMAQADPITVRRSGRDRNGDLCGA